MTTVSSRFTDPPGFGDSYPAPIINGLKPGDKDYVEAWCKKNSIPYKFITNDNS